MDPEFIKSWSNAITAPSLLVIICVVSWRIGKFFANEFLLPLGGREGSIAKFLEQTGYAVVEGPKPVERLHASFREIAGENVQLLQYVIQLTEKQNEVFSDLPGNSKISDSIRAKRLLAVMIDKLSKSPGINVDLSDELAKIELLLSKYDRQ